ncbi:MAG: substrate-binding domain-containing protein [Treponema sp.]|jgi:ribose transport system substrate-binding protein|nr:substrate-binding domain-containing protein [Treponema sp.]
MQKRKMIHVFVSLLLAAGVFTGCGPKKADTSSGGLKIGLSTAVWGNTWSAAYVKDFEEAAEAYKKQGIISEYQVATSASDLVQQINACTAMINTGIDALLIWPVSAEGIKPIVDLAVEKGTLAIICNDPAAYEGTYGVFGNNDAFQEVITNWFVEQLGGRGDIIQIAGVFGHPANEPRQAVVDRILARYPAIRTLAIGEGKYSTTDAQAAMTVYLSTYSKVDGVLTQDVMSAGILNAYKNAGIEPRLVTGDYTKEYIDMWAALPDLNSITVTVSPGIIKDALGIAINLLQGKEFKADALQPNPLNPGLANCIIRDPAYVVTREGNPGAPWMQGLNGSKAITLNEAVNLVKGMQNTDCLDGWLAQNEIDAYFK